MPPMDAKRAARRAKARERFAKAATHHMLANLKLDVAVFDMGDWWEVIQTDGQELTPAQARAFRMFRAGFRLLNTDV